MFIVYFNGEFDLDEFGNVIVVSAIFDSFSAACEAAAEHERLAHCLATVELWMQ